MNIKKNIFRLFLIFISVGAYADNKISKEKISKEELVNVLKNLAFNDALIKDLKSSIWYEGHVFKVDEKGTFYLEKPDTKKHKLEIYINKDAPKKEFLIFDPDDPAAGLKVNPLSTNKSDDKQLQAFDDLVSTQRLRGMHTMKTENPECYIAYALQRLGPKALEKLHALERTENPRPLAFENDADWADFQKELKEVLKPFSGPDAYVTLLGTSTTFFSENPKKGKNSALYEGYPECLKRINDPVATLDVYSFDTPQQEEKSDIDIDIFSPKLSELCEEADQAARKNGDDFGDSLGNKPGRILYVENTLDKCLLKSADRNIRTLVNNIASEDGNLFKAAKKNKKLGQFLDKWTGKLKRPLNFSVGILPYQRQDKATKSDERNFNNLPHSTRKFVIKLD